MQLRLTDIPFKKDFEFYKPYVIEETRVMTMEEKYPTFRLPRSHRLKEKKKKDIIRKLQKRTKRYVYRIFDHAMNVLAMVELRYLVFFQRLRCFSSIPEININRFVALVFLMLRVGR